MYYGLINSMNRASASGYPINLKVYLDAGNTLSYSGSGINWYDLTTNANNATLINGVGFDSANRGSLTFNGTNQYCSITNVTDIRLGNSDFYIGQFVNFSTIPVNRNLCSLWGATTAYSYFFTIIGGVLALYWSTDGTNATFGNLTSTYIPPINTWLYLSVSRTGGVLTLYANGINVASASNSANFFALTTDPFVIGKNLNQPGWELNGKCSHFKLQKGIGLTTAEVLTEYNTQKYYYVY